MNDSKRKKTIGNIVIFCILVTVLAFISPLLGGSPSKPGFGFILWGAAPLLVSLLMRAVTRDWSDLGIKPEIKKNIRWYIISFLALPVLMVLVVLAGNLLSISSFSGFSTIPFFKTAIIAALPVFLVFAIFEEVGWRGYLVPKLASLGINNYVAAALVAIVWASWHLPYISGLSWVYSSENLIFFIPRFYLLCFALSIVYGKIRNSTASFWPAVLMHAIGNSFGHPLSEYLKITAGKEYLGALSNGLIFIAFVTLLGIVMNRWGLGKLTQLKSSSEV